MQESFSLPEKMSFRRKYSDFVHRFKSRNHQDLIRSLDDFWETWKEVIEEEVRKREYPVLAYLKEIGYDPTDPQSPLEVKLPWTPEPLNHPPGLVSVFLRVETVLEFIPDSEGTGIVFRPEVRLGAELPRGPVFEDFFAYRREEISRLETSIREKFLEGFQKSVQEGSLSADDYGQVFFPLTPAIQVPPIPGFDRWLFLVEVVNKGLESIDDGNDFSVSPEIEGDFLTGVGIKFYSLPSLE